nr:hypothetical protein [Evansella caseinilytica]
MKNKSPITRPDGTYSKYDFTEYTVEKAELAEKTVQPSAAYLLRFY